MNHRGRLLAIGCTVFLVALAAAPRAQRTNALTPDNPDRWLPGAVDIHVHSSPDTVERSVDAVEAAMMARVHRMRAIVLKNHYDSTAPLVTLVRRLVPGIEIYGGIDLNLPVGGMNPAAVEHMTQILGGAGRFVWMSTYDAENQVRFSKENRPFVRVSKDGALLQSTKDVIAVIAKHGLVLATGHVSAEEGLLLVREGRRQGVQHMVITHAMNSPIEMTIPQMQEAAREGAFIEFAGQSLRSRDAAERVKRFAEAIRAVGPASCILSSDLGQKTTPLPTDGLAMFTSALSAQGFTDAEIDRMSKVNPATLLGLTAVNAETR
jgi:uncharacterized protein DUF6282